MIDFKLNDQQGKFLAVVFTLAGLIVLYNAGKAERNHVGRANDSELRRWVICADLYSAEHKMTDLTIEEFYGTRSKIQKRACQVIASGDN